jgi:phosphate transport system protein
MTKHIVTAFDTDLRDLLLELAQMAGWVERAVEDAVDSLMTGAGDEAESVISNDDRIDEADRKVEGDAVLLIARRQPMGDDLRVIVSSMRVSQDLERVGDLAKNIAKRALIIDGTMQQRTLAHGVDSLSRLVLGQLKRSIEAFVERDTTKAEDVWRHDAEIDALYTSLFRELLTYMMEDPRNISPAPICCSAPRTWSASAIMRPTSPNGRSTRAPVKWWRPTVPNRMSWARRRRKQRRGPIRVR